MSAGLNDESSVNQGKAQRRRPVFSPVAGALIVFAGSAVFTLLFWSILPAEWRGETSPDYHAFYEPVAQRILQGDAYTHFPEESSRVSPAAREMRIPAGVPPGYPILLAGLFLAAEQMSVSQRHAVLTFNLLCGGISSVLLFLVAYSLWPSWQAFIPSLLFSTYPFVLWLTAQPLSEVPFITALYAAVAIWWFGWYRHGRVLASFGIGLLVGGAMLTRPIAIALGLWLAVLIVVLGTRSGGPRLWAVLALLIGNALVVVPWEVYVYDRTGDVMLISSAGTPALIDGLTFAVNRNGGDREGVNVPPDVTKLMNNIQDRSSRVTDTRDLFQLMWHETRAHPQAVAKLMVIKAARSWYGTDSQRHERFIRAVHALYLVLILYATVLALRRGGDTKKLALMVWSITFYFWGMTILSSTLVRYMVPIFGLLFLLIPAIQAPQQFWRLRAPNKPAHIPE